METYIYYDCEDSFYSSIHKYYFIKHHNYHKDYHSLTVLFEYFLNHYANVWISLIKSHFYHHVYKSYDIVFEVLLKMLDWLDIEVIIYIVDLFGMKNFIIP